MALKLTQELKDIINDPNSKKVLATIDRDGNPHVVFKGSLHVNEAGYLEYFEFIESSQTNKNMVHSIWFHKTVAINILNGSKSYQIKGIPYRAIIAGREFEEAYHKVQEKYGDEKVDLSTVWLIEPAEVFEESFEKRRKEEEEAHPILRHLDLLIVK